jgi:hypothetical protein
MTGDGGIPATQEAISDGIGLQAAKTEFIRDFANGPLFHLTGATNGPVLFLTDPYSTNLQVGLTFNGYIEKIGFGDRFTSTGVGYASAVDFTNVCPLVKVSNSVRNHFNEVRFGRAHGGHLELLKADDSHFTQCYFDSSSTYTNTWSTIARGITIITNEPPGVPEWYDSLNTIHFEDCTWEVSRGGSINFTATAGNIGGVKITGCVLKTVIVTSNQPYEGKPNLVLNRVLDVYADVFCSSARTLDNPFVGPPIFFPRVVEVANCSGHTLNLRLQNIANGVSALISNLVYLTNSNEIRLGLHAKSTLTNLVGDVVNVDPSCYNIQIISPVQDWSSLTRRFSNIPIRSSAGMGNWVNNGEFGLWGSTNTDAVTIGYMHDAIGTNDFTYYARVKLPTASGVDKYIGGLSEFYTNVLGGANSVRFFLTSGGEMVFRQAGTNFGVQQFVSTGFNLWNVYPNDWLDLAWVRTSGAAGEIQMFANGRRFKFASTNLGELNFATNIIHLADVTNTVSVNQWDGAIGTSGLIQQALTPEQVYRLPIDGPPDYTRVKFWYIWDTDAVGWDRSTNRNHSVMYNGAHVRYGRRSMLVTSGEAVARLSSAADGQNFFMSDVGAQGYNSGGLIYTNLSVNNGNLYTGGASPFWQMFSTSNNGVLVDISGTSNAVFRIRNNTTPVLNVITNGVVAGGTNTVLYISDGATAKQVHSAPDAASVPANARVLYILP